ncbi:MAG: FHA domain-containing protein [Armatimonadetes bacterium]|nr:FHA domain-containing protein [Armatimonadota bacterium]
MDMPLGLILLIGKFAFLAALYAFLTWAFRGLFRQMGLEASAGVAPVPPQPAPRPVPAPVAHPVASAGAPPATARSGAADGSPLVSAISHEHARPRLVVQEPGQSRLLAGQVIELTAALTIGRADDNGLVIDDRFCSSHHALIFTHGGERILRDRDSTNGTYHNGRRITGDVVLRDGDRINIGTVALDYRAPGIE